MILTNYVTFINILKMNFSSIFISAVLYTNTLNLIIHCTIYFIVNILSIKKKFDLFLFFLYYQVCDNAF